MTDGNSKNQSLRATTAACIFNAGQEEQMVQSVTGHLSSTVCRYKHVSDGMKRKVSKIIQGAKKYVKMSKNCIVNKGIAVKRLVPKVKAKHVKIDTKCAVGQESSDDDFMPSSQNIHTFEANLFLSVLKRRNTLMIPTKCMK